MNDLASQIIAYETGELSGIEMIKLFSELVKNGMAFTLQGHYGRIATDLMRAGILDQYGEINQKKVEDLI